MSIESNVSFYLSSNNNLQILQRQKTCVVDSRNDQHAYLWVLHMRGRIASFTALPVCQTAIFMTTTVNPGLVITFYLHRN